MAPAAIAAALAPALGAAGAAKLGGAAAAAKLGGAAVLAKSGASAALASSFLESPAGLLGKFLEPEVAAYNWAHDKIFGAHLGDLDVAGPDQIRFVDYYAASCPHCKHLDPAWNDAMTQFAADGKRSNKLVFQKRECLDANWQKGKDSAECEKAGLDGFPTMKVYKAGSDVGLDYTGDRSTKSLLSFARDVVDGKDVLPHPDPEAVGKAVKLVDYYAASCHHCKDLAPVFDEAKEQWAHLPDKDIAEGVLWTKKECYDEHWKLGKDFEECQREKIHSFPTVRLSAVNPTNGAKMEDIGDFKGERTATELQQFLKDSVGLGDEPAAEPDEPSVVPVTDPSPIKEVAVQPSELEATLSAEPAAAGVGSPVASAVEANAGGAEAAAGAASPDHVAAVAVPTPTKLPTPVVASMPLTALTSLSCLGLPKARKSPAKRAAAAPPPAVSSFI